MIKSTLLTYTKYNVWANSTLLSIIDNQINYLDIDREIISSFPSVRKTIYHIWDAESIWWMRLNNLPIVDWPSKSFSGNFKEAKEQMLASSLKMLNFVEQSNEIYLNETFTYLNSERKEFSNKIWESVLHCMNHSTYHRGQVVTMLRQLGLKEIPSTDFITFIRQNK